MPCWHVNDEGQSDTYDVSLMFVAPMLLWSKLSEGGQ